MAIVGNIKFYLVIIVNKMNGFEARVEAGVSGHEINGRLKDAAALRKLVDPFIWIVLFIVPVSIYDSKRNKRKIKYNVFY